MAIQLLSMKCPSCGANLEAEKGREYMFCSYCGTKILINNDNEYIYRNIDEARIRESENELEIRLRELELEEKENAKNHKLVTIAYGVSLVFVIIGAFLGIWWDEGWFFACVGMLIAMYTYLHTLTKDKKRHVSPNDSTIPDGVVNYEKHNYKSVAAAFQGAGFTNVKTIPLNDLTIFNQWKNGQVEAVTVNGNSDFDKGDVFPKDAVVNITYHTK